MPSLEKVNVNYQQYLSNIRNEMYAWTRLGLSKMEKVYVGTSCRHSCKPLCKNERLH